MHVDDESPVFGIRLEGCRYTVRPSAYALLHDADGRLAIVRSGRGWFLPGGGIEGSETVADAVVREAREECGLLIEPGESIGTAIEIVHSPAGTTGIDKTSVFIHAVIVGQTAQTEPDHVVEWVSVEDAVVRLSHQSHRWAVSRSAR